MPGHEYQFWVYILSNRSHILYIGITNNLRKRIYQHRKQAPGSFTARYKITRLVYFERYQYANNAIAREKELKHWTRMQKIALIESMNPTWEELMPDEPTPAQTPAEADYLVNDKTRETSVAPLLLSFPKGICVCICRCFFSFTAAQFVKGTASAMS